MTYGLAPGTDGGAQWVRLGIYEAAGRCLTSWRHQHLLGVHTVTFRLPHTGEENTAEGVYYLQAGAGDSGVDVTPIVVMC